MSKRRTTFFLLRSFTILIYIIKGNAHHCLLLKFNHISAAPIMIILGLAFILVIEIRGVDARSNLSSVLLKGPVVKCIIDLDENSEVLIQNIV